MSSRAHRKQTKAQELTRGCGVLKRSEQAEAYRAICGFLRNGIGQQGTLWMSFLVWMYVGPTTVEVKMVTVSVASRKFGLLANPLDW